MADTDRSAAAYKPLGPYLGRDRLVCKCGHAVDQHPGTWMCTECVCILLEPTATTAHFALDVYREPCPYCGAEPYHACQARSDYGWPRPPHAARAARGSDVESAVS